MHIKILFLLPIALTYTSCSGPTEDPPPANFPWNNSIVYDTVTDRFGTTYKTVIIGRQRWMAENLNPKAANAPGICYSKDMPECNKYGRLLSWTEAMGIDTMYINKIYTPANGYFTGLCPNGWHIPTVKEYQTLFSFVDSTRNNSATMLKSAGDWEKGGSGTDNFGFRAIPSGYTYETNGGVLAINFDSYLLTSTQDSVGSFYSKGQGYYKIELSNYSAKPAIKLEHKKGQSSVRCIEN